MWYVLQVQTGDEVKIRDNLIGLGINATVPSEKRVTRKSGEWIGKEYNLFPGYIFVEIEYNAAMYYKIKRVHPDVRFLGVGINPTPLQYIEAEWIKELTNKGQPIEPTKVSVNEDNGVEIISGILLMLKNRIVKVDKHKKKITVEITICNEVKIIELSMEIVQDT